MRPDLGPARVARAVKRAEKKISGGLVSNDCWSAPFQMDNARLRYVFGSNVFAEIDLNWLYESCWNF
jgi:hypothetical protein